MFLYPRIHSEYDGKIKARPTPNADTFRAVDVRTLLRYFDTITILIYIYIYIYTYIHTYTLACIVNLEV